MAEITVQMSGMDSAGAPAMTALMATSSTVQSARRGASLARTWEAGAPLAAHDGVGKVTFTGETGTGRKIMNAASGNMKRISLELGGKSPSLVFADADLDAAVEGTFGAVFFNQGQCCIAGARVYVEDAVYDEFVAKLADRAGQVRLGSGLDAATTMGPLVSAEQRDKVLSLIDSGVAEGARIIDTTDRSVGDIVDEVVAWL